MLVECLATCRSRLGRSRTSGPALAGVDAFLIADGRTLRTDELRRGLAEAQIADAEIRREPSGRVAEQQPGALGERRLPHGHLVTLQSGVRSSVPRRNAATSP